MAAISSIAGAAALRVVKTRRSRTTASRYRTSAGVDATSGENRSRREVRAAASSTTRAMGDAAMAAPRKSGSARAHGEVLAEDGGAEGNEPGLIIVPAKGCSGFQLRVERPREALGQYDEAPAAPRPISRAPAGSHRAGPAPGEAHAARPAGARRRPGCRRRPLPRRSQSTGRRPRSGGAETSSEKVTDRAGQCRSAIALSRSPCARGRTTTGALATTRWTVRGRWAALTAKTTTAMAAVRTAACVARTAAAHVAGKDAASSARRRGPRCR